MIPLGFDTLFLVTELVIYRRNTSLVDKEPRSTRYTSKEENCKINPKFHKNIPFGVFRVIDGILDTISLVFLR